MGNKTVYEQLINLWVWWIDDTQYVN